MDGLLLFLSHYHVWFWLMLVLYMAISKLLASRASGRVSGIYIVPYYSQWFPALSPDNVGRTLTSSAAKFGGLEAHGQNHWLKISLKIHNVGNPLINLYHLGWFIALIRMVMTWAWSIIDHILTLFFNVPQCLATFPAKQEFEALSDDRKVEVLRKIMATWRLASELARGFAVIQESCGVVDWN